MSEGGSTEMAGFKLDISTIVGIVVVLVVCYLVYTYMYPSKPATPATVPSPTGAVPRSSGERLKMFYSPSCGFCQKQKKVLEENNLMSQIEMINCAEQDSVCNAEKITGVPAFKTPSGKKASGLQSAEQIKKLMAQ